MSQLYRCVHGILFNTSLVSSPILRLSARTCVSSTVESLTKPDCIYDMINEPDLRKMVDEFRLRSSEISFRKRIDLYNVVVQRLIHAKEFKWIEEILSEQKQYMSFPNNEGFIRGIMSLYGDANMFDHARRLFDEMPQVNCNPTVKSFNSLLDACIKSDRVDQVEEIFRQIPREFPITPNVISYTLLIRAYLKMGSLDSMLATVNEMEEKGITPDSVTYSFLLDGLYKNRRVLKADDVWESMRNKGIVPCIGCYNSKLAFLASEDRMKEVIKLFYGMQSLKLKPNKFTFYVMLKGFCDRKDMMMVKLWYGKILDINLAGSRSICEIVVAFATEIGDSEFGLKVCSTRRTFLEQATLQGVLDGLVKDSYAEEAKRLLDEFQGYGCIYNCEAEKLPLKE